MTKRPRSASRVATDSSVSRQRIARELRPRMSRSTKIFIAACATIAAAYGLLHFVLDALAYPYHPC